MSIQRSDQTAILSQAVQYGGTSMATIAPPAMKARFPILVNWWTAERPPKVTSLPTLTCPARAALFANTQPLPMLQSWATWL